MNNNGSHSNPLAENHLPTQLGQPQWWEERQLALSPLRPSEARNNKTCLWAFWPDLKRQLFFLLCLGLLSIVGYYLVSRFVATTVIVQGRSMLPTLQDGDQFILNRLSYLRHSPQRGDLVVVKDPGHLDYAIKRIIGTPSEILHFKGGNVIVNGKQLIEPYLAPHTETFLPDSWEKLVVLGKDQYYVLGDNRTRSEDSRYYGPVYRHQILGSVSK